MPRSRSTSDCGARTSPPAAPMPRCSPAKASSRPRMPPRSTVDWARSPRKSRRASWSRIPRSKTFTCMSSTACRRSSASRRDGCTPRARATTRSRPTSNCSCAARSTRRWTGIDALELALIDRAEEHAASVMPGFTHLQSGQPVTLGHHLLAYREMLVRDRSRFADARARMNEIAARQRRARRDRLRPRPRRHCRGARLRSPTANSLDAVSDRDFVVDYLPCGGPVRGASVAACRGNHPVGVAAVRLRQIARCLVDRIVDHAQQAQSRCRRTGARAIARGLSATSSPCWCCSRACRSLTPRICRTTNRRLFDAHDLLILSLAAMAGMVADLEFVPAKMRAAAAAGHATATDLADWLAGEAGVPFREAHHIAGRAVALAESQGKALDELGLDELRTVDPRLDERVLPRLSVESSVAARRSAGGTAPVRVSQAIPPRPGPIARSGRVHEARNDDRLPRARHRGLWPSRAAQAAAGQDASGQAADGHRTPSVDDLLVRRQAKPKRIDELLTKSQPRKADRFDLPPPMAAPRRPRPTRPRPRPRPPAPTMSRSPNDPPDPQGHLPGGRALARACCPRPRPCPRRC